MRLAIPAASGISRYTRAATETYTISGRVISGAGGVNGVKVTLKNRAGQVLRVAVTATSATGEAGCYSLESVYAGGPYTVTVFSPIYNFTSPTRSYPNLTSNKTEQTFKVTSRKNYSINGRVTTPEGSGVAQTVVTLSGGESATALTDANGYYSFLNLRAGFHYALVASSADYVFQPESRTVQSLAENLNLNFLANPYYILSGRVAETSGQGIFGINVSLSGPQTGATLTQSDGTYSFRVWMRGKYSVRPSKEQFYYAFTPRSVQLVGDGHNQTVNFSAALTPTVSRSYVLEFDGTRKSVDYDLFWNKGVSLGHFFWEFWAMPMENAAGTYLLSDGYGGAHALLFGFGYMGDTEKGRYQLYGNVWDGSDVKFYWSDEGPAPHEWGHFAVGWDGQQIVTYFNGVPVGRTEFTGPRFSPGPGNGGGTLLIGGSDHSNLSGRIAQVRGFEGVNPREADSGGGNSSVLAAFAPETIFSVKGNLLSYYFRPAERVADLSLGHDGKPHTGVLRGTANGVRYPCDGCPVPQYVVDPRAPDFSNPANPGQPIAPVDSPPPVPSDALVFDSFSRRNSTYILGGTGGLGSTEGGINGVLPWRTTVVDAEEPQPFGILNGRAVLLANETAVAWVEPPSGFSNLDIRIQRHLKFSSSGQNTGLSFRVLNGTSYFFAYTSEGNEPTDPKVLTVGYYLNGVRTQLATGIIMPATWTTLRAVTTTTGNIEVFADTEPVFSTINPLLASATGAGLYNNSFGLGLTNRWDNFRIFEATVP